MKRLLGSLAVVGVTAVHAAGFDRQLDNLLYAVPEGYAAIDQAGRGVVMVLREELGAGRRISHALTISKSVPLQPASLATLGAREFCSAFAAAIVTQELGSQVVLGEIEIPAQAAQEGYDLCQVAASGTVGGVLRSAVYVFTRSKGLAAYLTLNTPGEAARLKPHVPGFKRLLDSVEFVNQGQRLTQPAPPLPASFDTYLSERTAPQPATAQRAGQRCRSVTRQQCMSQMMGSFPNAYPVYQCLPRTETVCEPNS